MIEMSFTKFKLIRLNFLFLSICFSEMNRRFTNRFLRNAGRSGDLEDVDGCLHSGMPVDVTDEDGWTALHHATTCNRTKIAKRLLQAGADINKKEINGNTPLHLAAYWNKPEIARLLIDNGANIQLKNKWNETPLDRVRNDEVKDMLLELQQIVI